MSTHESWVEENEVLDLIRQDHRWIDVRAPIEYAHGSIPNSINLPIMNDEERRLVGTCFKQQGREAAIELGHHLVSGKNKDQKIQSWLDEIKKQSPNISLFCFRGGLRSQISQQWIRDQGVRIRRVRGGYKEMRALMTQYLRQQLSKTSVRLISGPTGSWKTPFLQWLVDEKHLAIDLEKLAQHRGSAFGKQGEQPAQVNFEHAIVKAVLNSEAQYDGHTPLYLEDESRMIGRCVIPDFFFAKMRSSPIIWIDEPLERRVDNIFHDYVEQTDIVKSQDIFKIQAVYQGYKDSMSGIKKRLGHEKYTEIMKDILSAESESVSNGIHDSNRVWIQKLLEFYYDPMYLTSLARRNPVTLIKATTSEIKSFLSK